MHTSTKNLRVITITVLVLLATSLLSVTAKAQQAADVAHRVLRQRILSDASDRRDVRFLTTSSSRMGNGWRSIMGRGRFARRGKSPQTFTYHIGVNPRSRATRNAGYDIR